MSLNVKNRINNLLSNPWFVTLFATTLGVLLAFYLNNLNARSKLKKQTNISVQNITKELASNKAELLDSKDNDQLIFFLNKVDEIDNQIPNNLVTTTNTINYLRNTYPDFIAISDSTRIDNERYDYEVDYRFVLSLKDLQSIAWETSVMSNITNELNYNCLQNLVKIYHLQEIYTQEQQKILTHFINAEHVKLRSAMLIVVQLENQLLEVIEEGEMQMEECS